MKNDNIWKKFDEEKPLCYKTGIWDGKKSDQLLFCDKGHYFVGECYEGTQDGREFFDIVDENGYTSDKVDYWMEIPKIL